MADINDLIVRRFRAKRINEHIKSVYALSNTLAAAIIGAAYVLPAVRNEAGPNELDRPGWIVIGLTLHLFGHAVIRLGFRPEE